MKNIMCMALAVCLLGGSIFPFGLYDPDDFKKAKVLSEKNKKGEEVSEEDRDFGGVNFSNIDLSDMDLSGANFRGAQFRGTNLEGTNFTGAILERADLFGAKFEGANLEGVDLELIDFNGVDFFGVKNMDNAFKERARCRGAINVPK